MTPAIISVFNNKGGVGKTTLTFHLAHKLGELGHKVLLIDLDPQCNLTLHGISEEALEEMWKKEDDFIDGPGFDDTKSRMTSDAFTRLNQTVRTIHYVLKPTEEGTGELETVPPPLHLTDNVHLVPGRLTLHMFEDVISRRWSDIYLGQPLAIRTITRLRVLCENYVKESGYNVILLDTSPSLGALNKVAISTVDGFFVPCYPDVFSLYGIRNIGKALQNWKREFDTMRGLLSDVKQLQFPKDFVNFLGYTIYNARKYTGSTEWDLAQGHHNYAKQIPGAIQLFIPEGLRKGIPKETMSEPIGSKATMHSHSTMASQAQKYKTPIWKVPSSPQLQNEDKSTVSGNRKRYEDTSLDYEKLAESVLERIRLSRES